MPKKTEGPTTYELANEIVRRAGHEDPESVDPMERFKLVMAHVLKQPKPDWAKRDKSLS